MITAFGPACLHGIQTDLADVRAVNDALLARVSELGDGQATLMARLVLDERQIGSLSAEERALLARVMAVEEREIAQAKRIELVQAHLARLDDWARDVDTRLKSSEQRLVELIRQRDKRVEAALLRLASAVDENRELIERQGVDVSGLLRWRADAATRASSPQVVASTTTQISGVVKKMVSMVSINANFGPVSVGVSLDKLLDVISEVGDRIMKRGGP